MNSIDAVDDTCDEKIHALLTRATPLTAAERDQFLCHEFGRDATLRQQIYAHLRAKLKKMTRTETPVDPDQHCGRALLGKVLGDYRLTEIIGTGGVGTVYLGERADSAYSTHVAVKVLTNESLSHEAQRRFAAERQILANLNQPYIARLLDGGETQFNESFLVMEYVQGAAIDRYCDDQKLTVRQRLQLFIKVCQAVQYAHRNLVIHRDLKPANILVSHEGTPKLLDFGIAKLLDNNARTLPREKALHTLLQDRLLTPEYASPEQIRGQPVTTTSDVYALGIILYELLTGVRPYAVNSHNQLELERSICVIDPVRPSQMLARMLAKKPLPLVGAMPKDGNPNVYVSAPDINALSLARGLSAKRLQNKLNGDIDAIVMRALRKEPEKRYVSVEQLIEDIQRYLDQEPVQARQGNWTYYSNRFMRRHALGVTLSSVAIVALVGFAVVMSIQAKRIAEQRDKATQESARAESVSDFMQEVFTAADPYQSQDKQVTAKELLDKAAQRISSDLTQQPEVRAQLLEAIGKAYGNQEQIDLSIKYLEGALRLQRSLPTKDKMRLAVILSSLGHVYHEKGNFGDAQTALSEARNILESSNLTQTKEYLQLLIDSGWLEHRLSHLTLAQKFYENALNLSRQLHGNYHPETANMLIQLAQVMTWQSRYVEAEKYAREAVSIFHATLPDKHPDRINADISLGEILFGLKRLNEAGELLANGLTDQRAVFGNSNFRLIDTYDSLSKLHLAQSQMELAEQDARTELSIAISNFGKVNFNVGTAHSSVAVVLLKRKKFPETEKEAYISLKILQATASPDHQYTASAEYLLAASLAGQRRYKEVEPMLRENMARWTRAEAPAWRAARTESVLGVVLLQLKKTQEAKLALTHSYDVLSAKDSGADADTIAVAKKRVEEFQRCAAEHRESSCQLSE